MAINITYSFLSGLPENHDFFSTVVDGDMNLIVAGNISTSTQGTDIHITKYNRHGDLVWERFWNDSIYDGDDFAVDVIIGNNLEIYVAGVADNLAQNATDMVMLKYNAAGDLLWQRKYDGAAGGHDAPAALVFDGNNSVYVTGATEGSNSLSDLALLRLSSGSGNISWDVALDNNNYYDAGAAITYANDVLYVTGGSGTAWDNWDIITLRYDTLGQQMSSDATSGSALGFNKPSSIAKDSQGNILVAGSVANVGNEVDMKIIKLDSDLDVIWSESYDYFNGNDGIEDLVLDNLDNIYFTGYATDPNGRVFAVLRKLHANGADIWERHQKSKFTTGYVKGMKVALSPDGQIAMSCNATSDYNQAVQTFGYSTSGELKWMKAYENVEGDETVHSLSSDQDNNFYVNGTSYDSALNKRYFSQKLAPKKFPVVIVTDTSGTPNYLDHQVIVAFQPSLVDDDFVGDRKQEYILLDDLIPAGLLNDMSTAYGRDISRNVFAEKIFKNILLTDTISISRNGYPVRIPSFYSRMLLHLPSGYDVESFAAACGTLFPDIQYAQLNYLGQLQSETSDTYIDEQVSLIPNEEFPNGSINLAPVWNNDIFGDPITKVGVYDDIIDFTHPDFGEGTLEGSKIAGGYDYNPNSGPLESATPGPHGTAVAGIIGALRDNGIGIAGIAGGDGNTNTGAALYSFGISAPNSTEVIPLADVSEAMVDGAMDTPYGLHIANHSWGITPTPFQSNTLPLLREATLFMFNNECAIVAIRGNAGNDFPVYPGSFNDSWVMTVGGATKDGSYKSNLTGDPNWASSFGGTDFIAPSESCFIVSTSSELSADNLPIYLPPLECSWYDNIYSNFAGTSAAAPHVTGVAALMHAHHNTNNGYPNNLAPEDYEEILEISAVDIGVSNGYDIYPDDCDPKNGHGRIDAAHALEIITMPDYRVHHIDVQIDVDSPDASIVDLTETNITLLTDMNGLEAGDYVCEATQIAYDFFETMGPNDQIESVWKRESSSLLYSDFLNTQTEIQPWHRFDLEYIINGNNIEGTVTGWFLKVFPEFPNTDNFVFLPAPPDQIRANLSLHIRYDETLDVTFQENDDFRLFPNPTQNWITVKSDSHQSGSLRIYDVSGKCLRKLAYLDFTNEHRIDLADLVSGVYFIQIQTDNQNSSNLKFVKL